MTIKVIRHPEVPAKRASKDARPGPSSFEGRATHGHLRMTDDERAAMFQENSEAGH